MTEEKNEKRKKVLTGMINALIAIFLGAYAGYGYLHYAQGIQLMSSPIILMNSYIFTAAISMLIILLTIRETK